MHRSNRSGVICVDMVEINKERLAELNKPDAQLTYSEMKLGYHFCPDWDYMLVGPHCKEEWDCCHCRKLEK